MSNETIVRNDAGEAASHNESARALTGKIAQLPKNIREELNRRLDDGQLASEILPWVNGLPAVKKILDKHFGGGPINERNLSLWRHNGYERWVKRQEAVAELKELAEDVEDFFDATGGKVARIAAMKNLKLLQAIPIEQSSVNDLAKISHAISALLNADQNQARLEYEKTRVFQGNERLVLSWDKFLRGNIDSVQRALNDQIAKDIQAADIDNGEKIELLGHHMFGRKWKGREVGKKGEAKEPEGPKKESVGNAEVKEADAQANASSIQRESPPHPSLSPDGGEGDSAPNQELPKDPENAEAEKAEGQTADQQVRPTTVQGHNTKAAVSPAEEKAEVKKMDVRVPTGAMGSKNDRIKSPAEKKGGNICGGLPTAATKANPVEPQASVVKNVAEVERPIEKAEAGGSPIKGDSTADQQVRPTTVQGHNTKAAVSPAREKAKELKVSGGLPTAATKAELEETDAALEQHMNRHSLRELGARVPTTMTGSITNTSEAAIEKTGMNISGSLPTAATSPVKAQEDPSVPKPSPWDSFSERVDVYSGFRPALAINLRSALGRNTLG